MSPDGKTLAVYDDANVVWFYDASTFEAPGSYDGNLPGDRDVRSGQFVAPFDFSPDGGVIRAPMPTAPSAARATAPGPPAERLGDDLPSGLDGCLDPQLLGVLPSLGQPVALHPSGVPVDEVEQRLALPEGQRLVGDETSSVGLAQSQPLTSPAEKAFEPVHVHVVRRN